jgi:hypothetical protein
MNCETLDILLLKALEGGLTENDRQAFDRHVAACARCRAVVYPVLATPRVEPPSSLLEGVLRRTSGSPCGRAKDLLCLDLDGELDGLDAELAHAHADGCPDCALVRTTLARMAEDLSGMFQVEPPPRLVEGVLELTSRETAGPPRRDARRPRFEVLWNQLVRRPRFAWEAAYVGAMLFWLVLGAPLSAGSEHVRELLPDIRRSSSSLAYLRGDMSGLGRDLWASAERTWSSSLTRIEADLGSRTQRVHGALSGVRQGGGELREAIRTLDLTESGQAVKRMTLEAREALTELVSDETHPQE